DFIKIDRIGFTQDFKLLARHTARAANGKTGTWEWMTANETIRKAEFLAKQADFVLEQFTQRFDQLHVHAFRQAANIMVRLDRHRWPTREGNTFDHVRIERPLHEEIRASKLLGFFLEHFD